MIVLLGKLVAIVATVKAGSGAALISPKRPSTRYSTMTSIWFLTLALTKCMKLRGLEAESFAVRPHGMADYPGAGHNSGRLVDRHHAIQLFTAGLLALRVLETKAFSPPARQIQAATATRGKMARIKGGLKVGVENLSAQQETLHRQLDEERRAASDNRAPNPRRLEQHVMNVGAIEGKVITIGLAFDAQRTLIEEVSDRVAKNHAEVRPTLDQWKRIKMHGRGASAILPSLGATGATVLWWAGDAAVAIARRWLRID